MIGEERRHLSRLVKLGEKDVEYIEDIILSFIVAGKDAAATTLSWFFYVLCKHPIIQEKVAQERREEPNLERELKHR